MITLYTQAETGVAPILIDSGRSFCLQLWNAKVSFYNDFYNSSTVLKYWLIIVLSHAEIEDFDSRMIG